MIDMREIARGIYRIALWDEDDLVKGGLFFPGATYNMFLIKADKPAIIETMFRRTFRRICSQMTKALDPSRVRYVVVPHHEGDSSGAINAWLSVAPEAEILCSELCAALSLRDFADKEPTVVVEGQMIDLGSHRLRFLITPQVNQWDSLMIYEETTGTLFPNDLFSSMGTTISTDQDHSEAAIAAARDLGYQPDDRASLNRALDKIASLEIKVIATMHGPTVTGHFDRLIRTFRNNALTALPSSP